MKKIATIILTCIIGLSMTMAPTLMYEHVYADDTQDPAVEATTEPTAEDPAAEQQAPAEEQAPAEVSYEGLAGMNVADIENNPELCFLLDDPTFFRYYEIDENGIVCEKHVDLDEVEKFLAEADANADGIDDVDNVETNGDITAMGGGVTGLGKGQTPAKYAGHNRYHCIDISWWQGNISADGWQKIKAAGVTHVIARCGYSALKTGAHNSDSTFANNVNGAYAAGIKVGVYYYSTAVSAAEAQSEAQYVTTLLADYKSKITLPVAFDYETGGRLTSSVMKSVGTASCTAFCDTIRAAGYTPMVYANYNTLNNYIDYRTLQSKYKIWLANYTTNGTATTYAGDYWMWQYSSSGVINGLSKKVDINYIFEPKSAAPAPAVSSNPVKPAAPKPVSYTTYKVKSKVNYRTGPGTNYKKKGVYKKGKILNVVSISNGWAKLDNGCYLSSKHIKKVSASSGSSSYTAKTTTSVNYRTGPGTKYKIKGTYKKGTKVTIKSKKNGWGLMSNGYYISLNYVK